MIRSRTYDTNIVCLWSDTVSQTLEDELSRVIVQACNDQEISGILILFSQAHANGDDLIKSTSHALISAGLTSKEDLLSPTPTVTICGCSTSGEVTPEGFSNGSIVVLLFPKKHFTFAAMLINEVNSCGIDDIAEKSRAHLHQFQSTYKPKFDHVFSMLLIDGLTYSEEAVTSALHRGLGDIPIIGGSAGDDLQFVGTTQLLQNQAYTNSAVVILVECRIPFLLFNEHNLIPTEHKLVVTDADPDKRLVREFNAEPAAVAYARAIGLDPSELTPMSFASHTVVVRVGGEYHCRAIQKVNQDYSLSFFCAIDNGLVLTVARSEGMVRSTKEAIDRFEHHLGQLSVIIGFDCIYRRLDAQHRNATERIETLYTNKNFVGFNSYGEQFHSMHVNQTFTGIAIGQLPNTTVASLTNEDDA